MAEISKFFNAQEIAPGVYDREYLASDFAKYFSAVLSAGLLLDENQDYGLQVTHQNNLDITVSVGSALIKGYYYENTTPLTLSHSIPETNHDRIDRIVLRMDLRNQSRYIKAFVKEGIASSNPVPPELQRDEYIYELSLAQVVLRANTASINPNDILDERALEDVCGIVQSLITVPTSVFQQQFDMWLNNWKTDQTYDFENWREQEQEDFETWLATIQDLLDENVAGNLAAQITALANDLAQHEDDKSIHKTSEEIRTESTTPFRTEVVSSLPSSGETGRIIFDESEQKFKGFDGVKWV